jgi:hypothetical protein
VWPLDFQDELKYPDADKCREGVGFIPGEAGPIHSSGIHSLSSSVFLSQVSLYPIIFVVLSIYSSFRNFSHKLINPEIHADVTSPISYLERQHSVAGKNVLSSAFRLYLLQPS